MTHPRHSTGRKTLWQTVHEYAQQNRSKATSALYAKALLSSAIAFDQSGFMFCLIITNVVDILTCYFILNNVKYTNIDWTAYMEQVRIFRSGQFDYFHIRGDTGPLVYPAGHLYIYTLLNWITNDGQNVELAQRIFTMLYLVNQVLVQSLFYQTRKIGGAVLCLMFALSHRIHSIHILRLFNDPIAMFFLFVAANLFIRRRFALGCFFYSLGVSVKMNILLFAPAVFFILLLQTGFVNTVLYLTVCALTQVAVATQFLIHHPVSYLSRAFELGRVFQFRWSVNWQFVPESTFLATKFHLVLLLLHIVTLLAFMFTTWFRENGGLFECILRLVKGKKTQLSNHEIIHALFTANLAGVVFARSIHFQFYSWYYHSLFYLAFSSIVWKPVAPNFVGLRNAVVHWIIFVILMGCVEVVYNIYPPQPWSSSLLFVTHISLVSWLLIGKSETTTPHKKVQ